MTTPHLPQILSIHDAGNTPAQIATSLSVSLSTVYATLRQHRPGRSRAPRTRSSTVRARVLSLAAYDAGTVAMLVGVSAAYVYRLRAEGAASQSIPPPPY